MLIPVVLSGGSGTRLWPLSRKMHPKQLLPLLDDNSLLQNTLSRFGKLDIEHAIIVCNEDYRFMVAEQARQVCAYDTSIILEPAGRNTAPAIALAAIRARQIDPQAQIIVLPADHDIRDVGHFLDAVQIAAKACADGRIATFGVVPDRPETGFGYIRAGEAISDGVFAIDAFVEKPDQQTAQGYLDEGGYYWNSGMFMFGADTYLQALQRHAPAMKQACDQAMAKAVEDMDFLRVDREAFEACPADSIDYAVMEKADNTVVLPVDIGWSDVGSFSALYDIHDKDGQGNAVIGDVISRDTTNSYLRANDKLLVSLGVDNLVVVDTDDALLVADKDRVQDIKAVVDTLTKNRRDEALLHKKVCRPWGCYQGIDAADGFQVKRITVKPGAVLSLQMHHHRAEHWVIVSGTAKITRGDEEFTLYQNESTFIPLGTVHRLENIGKIPLELIEVQTGSYLGEDDIVRFDDVYGRAGADSTKQEKQA